jgi:hypothetical protein
MISEIYRCRSITYCISYDFMMTSTELNEEFGFSHITLPRVSLPQNKGKCEGNHG